MGKDENSMPKVRDLPSVLREIVMNAPPNRRIQAFIAAAAPLCALATRVRLQYYYDRRLSALLVQVIIEGAQSSGKSFAADIEDLIMANTLKLRDKQQRRLEQDYREKKKRRKANERLEEEPKTTIRVIPATISKTVLVKRADFYERIYGDTLSFWMFAEELAMVTDAGRQGYSNLRTIMRTAYDLGSQFGIDFASDNAYSAIVDINICSMFCATPSAVDDYMDRKAIEGGNVTRCILCPIDDELGSDGARFKPYTDQQTTIINNTLQRMMDDTYESDGKLRPEIRLDTSWLDPTVRKWCVEQGHQAKLSGSNAVEVFRKRASVSAFRIAALCLYIYGIDGVETSVARKRCRQIYLYMADYIMNSLLNRWGRRYDELSQKRHHDNSPVKREDGIFYMLGDTFSRAELKLLVEEQHLTTPARQFIWMWSKSGDIVAIDKNNFRKVTH